MHLELTFRYQPGTHSIYFKTTPKTSHLIRTQVSYKIKAWGHKTKRNQILSVLKATNYWLKGPIGIRCATALSWSGAIMKWSENRKSSSSVETFLTEAFHAQSGGRQVVNWNRQHMPSGWKQAFGEDILSLALSFFQFPWKIQVRIKLRRHQNMGSKLGKRNGSPFRHFSFISGEGK